MRTQDASKAQDDIIYLFSDHLGSTTTTVNASSTEQTKTLYTAFGTERYTSGAAPTSYKYTGQREAEAGLYFYNARYYDPSLGRFSQPDTIVPQPANPQDWDRYAYTRNNPVRFNDPSGHSPDWWDYARGALSQYLDDVTLGLFGMVNAEITGFNIKYDGTEAFQEGREAGRAFSDALSSAEAIIGLDIAVTAFASIPPTGGGGAALALPTGGASVVVAGVAIPVEAAIGVGGVLVGAHGVSTQAYIQNNPVGMSGKNGPQISSKSLWTGKQGRLDIENPSPGNRPGQIHFQQGKNKWIYDSETNSFRPAKGTSIDPPGWLNDLLEQPDFQKAIDKGLQFLGD